jgi:hypothetical protein
MLVDQEAPPKDLYFQIHTVVKPRTVGNKFQQIIGMRSNPRYFTPDLPSPVRPAHQSQQLPGVAGRPAEKYPGRLHSGYFLKSPLPAWG